METAKTVGVFLAALAIAILIAGVLGTLTSDTEEVRGGERPVPVEEAIAAFDPEEIADVLPRDAIAAIFEPALVPAATATLPETDFVIGVELAGRARAYPIRVLSAHEIVNDEIARQPFAVSW
jgi:hypothetical protein